ncbi:RND family efflux transporter MFP subunit [Orenia metallireducens]|uniref:RND family efflux transporter, MFP subunit n=1 Tax=Orenia metallireducens TaxID=1413210 RepID=A0A285HD87_9FIRM|nr:efflux RND transporter periplasmic adaptor subunit [Orenia metallireducens]PRX27732.1 RND family efflux transporter MFP subunit [Orenia metallireducens]SNY33702.1 RND family efflux transporter, MFP subunit [Orenia metallireducens]
MLRDYKRIIMVLLILGVTVTALTGCGSKQAKEASTQEKPQEVTGIPVEAITAKTGEITNYITVTGTAKAVKSADLTPQLQKKVIEVLVDEGDRVEAGDKLIQLDQADIKAQVAEAQTGLKAAQAALEELLAGSRQEEIDKLTAQVEQAKASYEQKERDYKRYQRLFDKEAVSKQQLESVRTEYISAKNNYKALQESLKMSQAGPTQEAINTQKSNVAQAEAKLDTAKLNLAKTEITAPFAGVIAEVNIEVGEMAGTQPVISIINLSSIKIKTYVSEKNINNLELNQPVEVDFNALDHKLEGKIANISPALNQEKLGFPVEINVDNSSNLIKAGMYAEVKIEIDYSAGKVVIPKQALIQEDGNSYIYIVENNKAVKKKVSTGLTTTEDVEVLSGIEAGDRVITVGSEQLTAGYEVRIVGGGGQ